MRGLLSGAGVVENDLGNERWLSDCWSEALAGVHEVARGLKHKAAPSGAPHEWAYAQPRLQ
jgi:hypothetical protein